MSVSYFIFYRGVTADPRAFIDHYRMVHAPLLWQFPGIEDVRINEPVEWRDGEAVSAGGFLLITELRFPDLATLETAIASPARRRAREDFDNFPAIKGDIWHQATSLIQAPPAD